MKTNSMILLNESLILPNFHQSKLLKFFEKFVQPNCPRCQAQDIASKLTFLLMQSFFKTQTKDNILLIPILRGGMAMWTSANHFFNYPESLFITCKKYKGTQEVESILMINKKIKSKSVIILDTVAATGDTLCHVVEKLSPYLSKEQTIQIATCFISPEAVEKLHLASLNIYSLSTVFLMKGVDISGYLIPYIGGDVGDKLYGTFS